MRERMNCVQCNMLTILNSKMLCSECVFKNNHSGKSRQQVYIDRKKLKITNSSSKISNNIKSKTKRVRNAKKLSKNNDREVYYKVFLTKPPYCEECGVKLPDKFEDDDGKIIYIHQYSHILSKGSYPELRDNVKNFNRLCHGCHYNWEFGNRTNMKINQQNVEIIQELRALSRVLK